MRYYMKEYLNQDYELEAMHGIDALVSTQFHEVIHVDSTLEKSVICTDLARYYYGIGVEECHDYQDIAQKMEDDPLNLLQYSSFRVSLKSKNPESYSEFYKIIYDMDFQKVIQEEIKKFILRGSLDSNSLLYALLTGMGYTFESMSEDIPIQLLASPLSDLQFLMLI